LQAQLLHGVLQGGVHFAGAKEFAIEELHQFGGALVVDVPQREEKRGSAGVKQPALETEAVRRRLRRNSCQWRSR